MDAMLPSRLGKLRIVCSLPLFSDSICLKSQSAAEHGFTQVLLSLVLGPALGLSVSEECDLVELGIFAELPKAYLGDPSYWLRKRHPEARELYREVRGRLWRETENNLILQTTRSPELYGLHELIDSYSSMLFIEKECVLGNGYFASERHRTSWHKARREAMEGRSLAKAHPAPCDPPVPEPAPVQVDWIKAVRCLDELFEEASRARLEGGIGEYSATFIGMMEKLKEHYRYKGWSYHYPESVGEHTFQVLFFARLICAALQLPPQQKLDIYRGAALHDLAEAYASDIIYPVKMREKDLNAFHVKIEMKAIEEICKRVSMPPPSEDPFVEAVVDICDRYSAKLYFDREVRSGNTHFLVPNVSLTKVREKYSAKWPEIFQILDQIWDEYLACFATPQGN